MAIIYPNTSVTRHVIVEDKDPPLIRPQIDLDPKVPFQLWPRTSVPSDGSGSFHIDRVPPGDYVVHAWESRYYITVRQDGKEVPGNLIRIVAGSSPNLEVVIRKATAAIRVTVKRYWKYSCVLAVPEDAWDDTASWTVSNGSVNGTSVLPVAHAGAYLVMAVNLPFGTPNYQMQFMREELRRHESQGTSVVPKDGSEEAITVSGIDLDKTDVAVAARAQ